MGFIRFLKDWTLPVAIAMGTVCYLTFYLVPALDRAGEVLSPMFDTLFPITVFATLFVTFCKVDFHDMRPHKWHAGVLLAQLLLVGLVIALAVDSERLESSFKIQIQIQVVLGVPADMYHWSRSLGITRSGG